MHFCLCSAYFNDNEDVMLSHARWRWTSSPPFLVWGFRQGRLVCSHCLTRWPTTEAFLGRAVEETLQLMPPTTITPLFVSLFQKYRFSIVTYIYKYIFIFIYIYIYIYIYITSGHHSYFPDQTLRLTTYIDTCAMQAALVCRPGGGKLIFFYEVPLPPRGFQCFSFSDFNA